MLAAETAFEALTKDDSSAATLGKFQRRVESSWIKDELWPVRNFHQGFEKGMVAGIFNTGSADHSSTAARATEYRRSRVQEL